MKRMIVLSLAAAAILSAWLLFALALMHDKQDPALWKYLSLAEQQSNAGAYGAAIRCYERVIALEDTVNHRLLLAEACKRYGNSQKCRKVLEELLEVYPAAVAAYELLAEEYIAASYYKECKAIIEQAREAGVSTPKLDSLYVISAYRYEMDAETYDEATPYYGGYAVVKKDGAFWIIDRKGNTIGQTGYDFADVFFGSTAAVKSNGVSYYVDKSGERYFIPDPGYTKVYSYSEGKAAVQREGGGFGYIDLFGEPVLGEYLQVSNFSDGFAAVKDQQGWRVIDLNGQAVSNTPYEEIKLSDVNTIGVGGIFFGKTAGGYQMQRASGERIGRAAYEDVKPFWNEDLTAVKINGLWGFVDRNGELQIDPQYEDAHPFAEGLAAVKTDSRWGFIDKKNVMVIEPMFEDAKLFSEDRKVPVKIDGAWRYLSLKQ